MGFMRGRVDMKGACGCAWSYIEPGVMPDDEEATQAKVEHEVQLHAMTKGHSPTLVVIREDFYTHDESHPEEPKLPAYIADRP